MTEAKKAPIGATEEVVVIQSNVGRFSCCVCGEGYGRNTAEHEAFAAELNHYLQHPECKLLHIGQETTHANSGDLWHFTVAVVSVPRGSHQKAHERTMGRGPSPEDEFTKD
jgi:hypothetical protein